MMHADGLARPAGPRRGRDARPRLLAALATLGPDAATVFSPLPDEAALLDGGILRRPMTELERRWRAAIEPSFAALDLPLPPPARDLDRGRLDHGAPFRWLWGEFTSVRRADPGATW